jgi:hypothetical protein
MKPQLAPTVSSWCRCYPHQSHPTSTVFRSRRFVHATTSTTHLNSQHILLRSLLLTMVMFLLLILMLLLILRADTDC